jgi:ABC-type antimicrobial peptide transport system permease subunit
VARRTNEIGIRMALGARRETIVWMVLRDVLMLVIIGLAIGLPMALGASKLIASVLFGVKPGDPWSLVSALTTLLSAALAAGYLPALKASRTDPLVAVRHE